MAAREPQTLQEAILHFADYTNCHDTMVSVRWPDGVVRCPSCGSDRVTYLARVRRWKCYGQHPKPQFSLKTGTIFEDSPLPLQKWLPALWLLTNCKNGISSYELHRALKVTQKTAWFMLSRLRLALQAEDGGKLGGEVEVDETFIGGKARNMSKARKNRKGISQKTSLSSKVAVMGLLDRHGKDGHSVVRTEVIDGRRKSQLRGVIDRNIEKGATVYTDALKSYNDLEADYVHQVIDHAEAYVDGQIHTNGMENFWSLLKRALKGTYVSVEPFHLFRYLDEQSFRFNERRDDDGGRFQSAIKGVVNRRLTYKALTGSELPQTC